MIDYIHMSTGKFDYDRILGDNRFNFICDFNEETGEFVRNKYGSVIKKAELKNLSLKLTQTDSNRKYLTIKGSLHKYKNNGIHNMDDFNLGDLRRVTHELCDRLLIKPEDMSVHSMEFGLNITPPRKTSEILNGLLYHPRERFKNISIEQSDYYQVNHQQYILKAYDKALHYSNLFSIKDDILRFELKTLKKDCITKELKKASLINSYRNLYLNELLDENVYKFFGEILIKKWNEIIMYDYSLDVSKLSDKKRVIFANLQNPSSWEKMDKEERRKMKAFMYKHINNNSQNIQSQISLLLEEKLHQCLQITPPPTNNVKIPVNSKNQYSLFD